MPKPKSPKTAKTAKTAITPIAKSTTLSMTTRVPPGEHPPHSAPPAALVDTARVTQAVHDINAIHKAKGLETARAIGEYVLATFFDGDTAKFESDASKNPSFRALSQREDLSISHSALWYSVAVLGQLRQLPAEIGEALPMSHHRLLLPVKDAKAKLKLAKKAVAANTPKAVFADQVRAVRKRELGPAKSGRPALPLWAKGIGHIRKAVVEVGEGEIDPETVAKLGTAKVQARLDEVRWVVEALQALEFRLEAALVEGLVEMGVVEQ